MLACFCVLFVPGVIQAQDPPVNAELVGQWDDFAGSYGDVWGDGNFAYIGGWGNANVFIIDISDPVNPGPAVQYVLPPPNTSASAQDVKVADGLLFVGLEGNSDAGVHIVDVRDPLKPAGLVDISIAGFNQIHNVFYDSGFLYFADSGSTRVGIVDLSDFDPDNPPPSPITTPKWIIKRVGTSFVHDVTVQDGRMYVSAWDSGLWIYDVTDVANQPPVLVGQTPDGGDNTHSCWPTTNGDFVVTGEERTGGGVKVYRITDDGSNLTLKLTDEFAYPTEVAFSVHNQTMIGYRLYNAWYEAGLQVFDIDPITGQLNFAASYDMPPGGIGVWGVYPFLGPNRVLCSQTDSGLYIIRVTEPTGDTNGDGIVDITDLLALLGAWGDCPNCPQDIDQDNTVGILDLLALLANWSS